MFRYLGISSHQRSLFPQLAADPRFDVFWVRHNAANRGGEQDLFPHLPDPRPGIVAFTATRRMSLVRSRRIPAFEKRPTAGDCYRFSLSHPRVDAVITAPMTVRQMRENLDRMDLGPMSAEELDWMRRIGDYVYGKDRSPRKKGKAEPGAPGF
jgi:aryl-alcohol dehydrogenase-like predicted oxidoreductase